MIILFSFVVLKKIIYISFTLVLSYIVYEGDFNSAFNIKLILFSLLFEICHSFFTKKIDLNSSLITNILKEDNESNKYLELIYFNLEETSLEIVPAVKSIIYLFLGIILLLLFWGITPIYYFLYTNYFYNLIALIFLFFLANCFLESKSSFNKIINKHEKKGNEFYDKLILVKSLLSKDDFNLFIKIQTDDFFSKYKISNFKQLKNDWKLKRKFIVHLISKTEDIIKNIKN